MQSELMPLMPLKTTKWDVNEFLDGEERVAHFLEAAFEDGDPVLIAAALREVARAGHDADRQRWSYRA